MAPENGLLSLLLYLVDIWAESQKSPGRKIHKNKKSKNSKRQKSLLGREIGKSLTNEKLGDKEMSKDGKGFISQ